MLMLFIIWFVTCYVVSISGVMDSVKRFIYKWLTGRRLKDVNEFSLKPLDCNICMSFWMILFASWIIGSGFWIGLLYACIASLLAPVFTSFIETIRDILGKWVNKLIDYVEND